MNKEGENELNLVSTTPVMAQRDLRPDMPPSPFLAQEYNRKLNKTPVMNGPLRIQQDNQNHTNLLLSGGIKMKMAGA